MWREGSERGVRGEVYRLAVSLHLLYIRSFSSAEVESNIYSKNAALVEYFHMLVLQKQQICCFFSHSADLDVT